MNRRGFFAALAAPFLARLAPKPKPAPQFDWSSVPSIRLVRTFDPSSGMMVNRFDVLFGFAPLKPEYTFHVDQTIECQVTGELGPLALQALEEAR